MLRLSLTIFIPAVLADIFETLHVDETFDATVDSLRQRGLPDPLIREYFGNDYINHKFQGVPRAYISSLKETGRMFPILHKRSAEINGSIGGTNLNFQTTEPSSP